MMQEGKEKPEGISILRFGQEKPTDLQIRQAAETFAEVFSGDPWNEVYKCGECELYSGHDTIADSVCPHCGSEALRPAYPIDETVNIISELFERTASVAYLVEHQRQIDGFAWGYLRTITETLSTFEETLKPLVAEQLYAFGKSRYFSIAEIGLRESIRGRGIGKAFLAGLVKDAQDFGAVSTVWTRKDTALTPICLKAGFCQICGSEVVFENHQLVETGNVIVGVDNMTPERVFFIHSVW